MASKRSKSSDRWLKRQQRDYFVRQAESQGQVSRAYFKLEQLDQKYRLLTRSSHVLELGAAPGGWTGYIEGRLSPKGRLMVVDPLPITTGAHTQVVEGLAGEDETNAALGEILSDWSDQPRMLDLVLSDMAPNMSGVRAVDQARSMALADVALDAAAMWLRPGGSLAIKAFQGEGLEDWIKNLRQTFKKVNMTKPKASRPESREVFVVAQRYMSTQDGSDRLV